MIAWCLALLCTVILLLCPFRKTGLMIWIRKLCVAAVFAAAAYMLLLPASEVYYSCRAPKTLVTIHALDKKQECSGGNDIVVKGLSVDGDWIEAADAVADSGNWIEMEHGAFLWRNYDQPEGMKNELILAVSAKESAVVVLEANQWHGFCTVSDGTSVQTTDTYQDCESEDMGVSVNAISTVETGGSKAASLVGAAAVFAGILLLFSFGNGGAAGREGSRAVWADTLRVLCIFSVVLLHYTCASYDRLDTGAVEKWYPYLFVNSATTFAVPCFFMLSGALNIREDISIPRLYRKSLPRQYLPLLVWSFFYITFEAVCQGRLPEGIRFVRALFSSQYNHLWFMYPLVGLYVALPVISAACFGFSGTLGWYAYALVAGVPMLLTTLARFFGMGVDIPWFAWGFPEIGLFVAGWWIRKHYTPNKSSWRGWLIGIYWSFAVIVLLSYYASIHAGYASKDYISAYGTLPVFLLAVCVFGFVYSLEPTLQSLSPKAKQTLAQLSGVSVGIYFVHLLIKELLDGTGLYPTESSSLLHMLQAALVNLTISAMVCYVGAQIPGIGILFGAPSERKCCNSEEPGASKSGVRTGWYRKRKPLQEEKRIFFSVDDSITFLHNLTSEQEHYKSAFDNPTLAWLRSMHDQYGMKVVLSCLTETDTFSLEMCTDAYREELSQNTDWLRFSFRSANAEKIYDAVGADEVVADYKRFVCQIRRIAGNKAVGHILRLPRGQAGREALIALTQTEEPAAGFLTTDRNTRQYCMSRGEQRRCWRSESICDKKSGLTFYSSDLRLETVDSAEAKIEEFSQPVWNNQTGELIVYTHEWALTDEVKEKTERFFCYAAENGYVFSFLEQ